MVTESATDLRRRLYEQFAMSEADLDRLAEEIAAMRVVAYEDQLKELAAGVLALSLVRLTDEAVIRRIGRESRTAAKGIMRTHNDELWAWLGREAEPTESAARITLRDRATWKTPQIAITEGMTARNEAVIDTLVRNDRSTGRVSSVQVRARPRTAKEPICQGIVAHGWFDLMAAPALPQHPRCTHSWEQSLSLVDLIGDSPRAWLGGWYERGEGGTWSIAGG